MLSVVQTESLSAEVPKNVFRKLMVFRDSHPLFPTYKYRLLFALTASEANSTKGSTDKLSARQKTE